MIRWFPMLDEKTRALLGDKEAQKNITKGSRGKANFVRGGRSQSPAQYVGQESIQSQ